MYKHNPYTSSVVPSVEDLDQAGEQEEEAIGCDDEIHVVLHVRPVVRTLAYSTTYHVPSGRRFWIYVVMWPAERYEERIQLLQGLFNELLGAGAVAVDSVATVSKNRSDSTKTISDTAFFACIRAVNILDATIGLNHSVLFDTDGFWAATTPTEVRYLELHGDDRRRIPTDDRHSLTKQLPCRPLGLEASPVKNSTGNMAWFRSQVDQVHGQQFGSPPPQYATGINTAQPRTPPPPPPPYM